MSAFEGEGQRALAAAACELIADGLRDYRPDCHGGREDSSGHVTCHREAYAPPTRLSLSIDLSVRR